MTHTIESVYTIANPRTPTYEVAFEDGVSMIVREAIQREIDEHGAKYVVSAQEVANPSSNTVPITELKDLSFDNIIQEEGNEIAESRIEALIERFNH